MKDRIEFGTKAETLKNLKTIYPDQILPLYYFTVKEWFENRDYIISCYERFSKNKSVIVRSSAVNEDTKEESKAGQFETVTDVKYKGAFIEAVEKVISSYDNNDVMNQILVQPMLINVKICGVAFTMDPNTLGNYYVINYDVNGLTDAVTSGMGKDNKLMYVFKRRNIDWNFEVGEVCRLLAELEKLFGQNNLDVEFAITENGQVYILQVRPLCIQPRQVDYQTQYNALKRIYEKIIRNSTTKPFLYGKKSIYGVMPDWNPAEMIGIRPKTLAMTLYQEMITDSIWAYQRDNYGYKNLRSFPIMVDFCGLPYIDVRVSFNSFVPAKLEADISEKLVDYYIQRLEENPSMHDKVEFEIVFSCYTLDLPERIQILNGYNFSEEEINKIINALRNVTNKIIDNKFGLWQRDYSKIQVLEKRYDEVINSDMEDIEKVYWLFEDCKRYGTLPFAGLARGAFIAVQILQSMVAKSIISREDYRSFMGELNTVSSNMNEDFFELTREKFLHKYGHLRPGTYDINSKRYDEAPDLYFDWDNIRLGDSHKEKRIEKIRLSMEQMHKLKDALEENELNIDILELLDFIKNVIEAREYSKFIFTKSLSKAMWLIEKIGNQYGYSRDDCAFLDIQTIKRLYSSTKDIKYEFKQSIETNKENYKITKSLSLPPLIVDAEDVWKFYYPDSEPNYITFYSTSGEPILLQDKIEGIDITNKIVLIPSADPGYDWIFSHRIKGFITMYGGANSHMAIRAGELGLPAVIGVGEKMFKQCQKAKFLEIDATVKTIKVM